MGNENKLKDIDTEESKYNEGVNEPKDSIKSDNNDDNKVKEDKDSKDRGMESNEEDKESKNPKKLSITVHISEEAKKKLMLCLGVFLMGWFILNHYQQLKEYNTYLEGSIPTYKFMEDLDKGKIDYVVMKTNSYIVDVYYKDGKKETTLNQNYNQFIKDLTDAKIDIKIQSGEKPKLLESFISILPTISVIVVLLYFLTMLKGNGNGLGGVLKSKASDKKLDEGTTPSVRFSDVAGLTEEKVELQEAILSLTDGEKLKSMGGKPVRGILLEGGPGVGKTMLAKAVAGEANVPFYSYAGSDFVEVLAGLGASRVRDMFDEALKNSPCVIFIDEIDAIGKKRSNNSFSGTEVDNTLIALLERMDGVKSKGNILFIGATNRVDILDSALIRPGRFDKVIHISSPTTKEDRDEIVKVHLRGKTLAEGVTLDMVSKELYGFSGAEIEGALNDAIIESFRDGKDGVIGVEHVSKAVIKLIVKGVAKGKWKSKENRELVAIHEAGHAMVYKHLGKKLLKVSIQPFSGGVGGYTQGDDEVNDKPFMTKKDIEDKVKILYGGMVAEYTLLGEVSTGASNDLEKATVLIDKMLSTYGLVDDNLIVRHMLNDSAFGSQESDAYIEKLNKIAKGIKDELIELFSNEEFKSQLIELKNELLDKETIYFNEN